MKTSVFGTVDSVTLKIEIAKPVTSLNKWAASVMIARELEMYPPMNSIIMNVKSRLEARINYLLALILSSM